MRNTPLSSTTTRRWPAWCAPRTALGRWAVTTARRRGEAGHDVVVVEGKLFGGWGGGRRGEAGEEESGARQTVRRLGRRPPGRGGRGGERRYDGCRRRPQWGGGRSMEATSRASNTNNHPAATANEGMLSFSSAYVDDAAVHGETAVARPRQPTASPPPPAPGWRQPQRTHQAVAAITILRLVLVSF
uniref:Uncharacterized protein n=1 Tax=Oryza sativa subsp. japonica TaxID=39947 RepID=Q653E7_ORYSJ|nr:hypothetical protein [Oryza sativa Japonica Group]BAD46070.1 hypothetical protein [Oryza sativa Japonica Group]